MADAAIVRPLGKMAAQAVTVLDAAPLPAVAPGSVLPVATIATVRSMAGCAGRPVHGSQESMGAQPEVVVVIGWGLLEVAGDALAFPMAHAAIRRGPPHVRPGSRTVGTVPLPAVVDGSPSLVDLEVASTALPRGAGRLVAIDASRHVHGPELAEILVRFDSNVAVPTLLVAGVALVRKDHLIRQRAVSSGEEVLSLEERGDLPLGGLFLIQSIVAQEAGIGGRHAGTIVGQRLAVADDALQLFLHHV